MFPNSLHNLLDFAYYCNLDLSNSYLTLDSGFDSKYNRDLIFDNNIIPVIKPNFRGLKDRIKRYKLLDNFNELKHVYDMRFIIERCFAWEDKYRKLVIRYERLQTMFMGFRYIAFSMINFRSIFQNPR